MCVCVRGGVDTLSESVGKKVGVYMFQFTPLKFFFKNIAAVGEFLLTNAVSFLVPTAEPYKSGAPTPDCDVLKC